MSSNNLSYGQKIALYEKMKAVCYTCAGKKDLRYGDVECVGRGSCTSCKENAILVARKVP